MASPKWPQILIASGLNKGKSTTGKGIKATVAKGIKLVNTCQYLGVNALQNILFCSESLTKKTKKSMTHAVKYFLMH